MENTENQRLYGDEKLGYSILARDMSPEDAREYLETTINDGIYDKIPTGRRSALLKRMEEED